MEGEPKVSVQIRTEYKGYPITIVKEDSGDKLKPLVDSTILTIDYLKEKGFVPIDGKNGDVYVAKPEVEKQPEYSCAKCNGPATLKEGINKNNKPYKGIFCNDSECGNIKWMSPKK